MARKSTTSKAKQAVKADAPKTSGADVAVAATSSGSDGSTTPQAVGEPGDNNTKVPAAQPPESKDAGADQAITAPASDANTPPERDPNEGTEGLAAAVSAALVSPDTDAGAHDDRPGPDTVQIVVVGPANGFWRAGRYFTKEPTRISAAELTRTQFEMLQNEPNLIVSVHDVPEAIKA